MCPTITTFCTTLRMTTTLCFQNWNPRLFNFIFKMGIYILYNFIFSFVIIFLVFWCIFYFVGFLIKKKYSKDEKIIYECGFKTIGNVHADFNIGFFWSAAVILLYELEIVFVLPVFVNSALMNGNAAGCAIFFLCCLNFTVFFDVKSKLIKWSY